MQIYVCVKHVPDTAANIKISGENSYDDAGCKFIVNPYDEYALEQAVQLVEQSGGEVVVVTVGKPEAVSTLRAALAMGAHRGILVTVDDQFLESRTTAAALKAAIERDGQPEIIFTGKAAVDSEGFQTPYRLAAALGLPVVNEVNAMQITDGRAIVDREIGGGARHRIAVSLPCVLGATKGLNEPRYPKFPDIMKAKKKAITEVALSELGISGDGAGSTLTRLEKVPERAGAKMLEGDLRQAAETLVQILKEQEKVI
jgi:electron transfer flavoprotein beta subunit